MDMRSAILVLAILSGAMWGSAGVFVRILSDQDMDSTTIVFTRVSIAAVMMLALILVTDRGLLRFEPRDLWMFLACAVAMLGLNAFYTVSVDAVSLSLAAVLLSLSPVFMLIMARVAFGERITSLKLFCMASSIIGCVMVSGVLEGDGSVSPSGVAAGLAAAFFYALYGLASKRAAGRGYSTYTILFYCLLISTVALVPFCDLGRVAECASQGWGWVGFMVLHAAVASFLPYTLYTTAMAKGDAGTSSILAACGEPVAAAVFGLLVFSEVPSPLMALGMFVAIGSMAVLCAPRREKIGNEA